MTRSSLEHDIGPLERSEPVQPDLWTQAESGNLEASTLLGPVQEAPAPRGRGRPPGSKNRSNEDLRAYLLAQGRHPLAVAVEFYSMKPRLLAERLGIIEEGEKVELGVLLQLVDKQLRMMELVTKYVVPAPAPQAVQPPSLALQINVGAGAEGVSVPSHAAGGPAGPVGLGSILASWSDADRSEIE